MIVNTTFMIHRDIEDEVLRWIRESYSPCAVKCGAQPDSMLARVLDANPDGDAYALHTVFESSDRAADWNEGPGAAMRSILARRYGERALTFTTYLQPLK